MVDAQKLIQKEKQEKTGKLDLGNCGLTDIPEEVFELTWLEELSFTNRKIDFEKKYFMRVRACKPIRYILTKRICRLYT